MKNRIKTPKYFVLTYLLTVCIALQGCDEFIEVAQPNSQLTLTAVFENNTTATAALTDIYAQMRENGVLTGRSNGLSSLLGTYADELTSFENGIYTTAPFYDNALSPSLSYIRSIWQHSYAQIYAANAVIEGINNSTALSENQKKQLKGEALFIRSLLHFYLTNLYGEVPYISSTNYKENSLVNRIPKEVIYENIIADLKMASNLIEITYIEPNRTRPNRSTIQALLARVYLYNGNYAEAANASSAVLNENSLYQIVTNLDLVFLKNSTSTIWQFSSGSNVSNTYEASTFILLAGPPTLFSLTEKVMNQFEEEDLRKIHWTKTITNGSEKWSFPFKYKLHNLTESTQENSIVFRMEEQLLIRAEARARQGETIGAIEDLNKIRNRAGLPNTSANTQQQIIESIVKERQVEFFTEYGHRFFDLKRWNLLDSTLNTKLGWNSNDKLWPLPLSEMNANPNLTPQNPGY